ncbi:hypothetical protein PanWU01x14_033890 [Parasponia andersonii]|uniref:Uncharacterized protein n=1 Tax=Parasponia andersonii TaxID=3476 RepID=A0A2P5DTS8_PARAD|nr:hypothetical protein PanWU01x14_033890 [Parasponia andersonii]
MRRSMMVKGPGMNRKWSRGESRYFDYDDCREKQIMRGGKEDKGVQSHEASKGGGDGPFKACNTNECHCPATQH